MQTNPDAGREALEAARRLAPQLRERALEGERLRTLPEDLAVECGKAGLFRLALPASLGGLELSPALAMAVIEECSRADGSAGWTIMIGNTTSFLAWLEPPEAAALIAGNEDAAGAGLLAPVGRAEVRDDGSYVVSGRWPFNSGSPHSAYFTLGVVVFENGAPRMIGPRPDTRVAFLPRSDVEILDTWHAAGLKGTGSHDVTVKDVAVPASRMPAPFFEPARHDGPLYRIPFWNLLNLFMVGWPLGVARRALDEFFVLARKKSRSLDGGMLADDPAIRIEFARQTASLRAARAYAVETAEAVFETVAGGGALTLEERSRITGANVNAMRVAVEVVDFAFHRAGGGALYEDAALQRCFRDVHAAGQHIVFSQDTYKRLGGVDLEVDDIGVMV